ncbi:MAG: hypothetical protein MZW92_40420 [Comamonadaceae bacterium]|nr:hypothetical protein [Comamonadaceae bacterium]
MTAHYSGRRAAWQGRPHTAPSASRDSVSPARARIPPSTHLNQGGGRMVLDLRALAPDSRGRRDRVRRQFHPAHGAALSPQRLRRACAARGDVMEAMRKARRCSPATT